MTEAEWLGCEDPGRLLASREACATDRKVRLWAVACCYRDSQWCYDAEARRLVLLAEEFADGLADRRALRATGRDPGGSPARAVAAPPGGTFALHAARVADLVSREVAGRGRDRPGTPDYAALVAVERRVMTGLLRDIFGNPFRPVAFSPEWCTDTVLSLARGMYESRDFSAMPILADALQDAGCENADVLDHCRGPGPHVRGCWVVDLILGKA